MLGFGRVWWSSSTSQCQMRILGISRGYHHCQKPCAAWPAACGASHVGVVSTFPGLASGAKGRLCQGMMPRWPKLSKTWTPTPTTWMPCSCRCMEAVAPLSTSCRQHGTMCSSGLRLEVRGVCPLEGLAGGPCSMAWASPSRYPKSGASMGRSSEARTTCLGGVVDCGCEWLPASQLHCLWNAITACLLSLPSSYLRALCHSVGAHGPGVLWARRGWWYGAMDHASIARGGGHLSPSSGLARRGAQAALIGGTLPWSCAGWLHGFLGGYPRWNVWKMTFGLGDPDSQQGGRLEDAESDEWWQRFRLQVVFPHTSHHRGWPCCGPSMASGAISFGRQQQRWSMPFPNQLLLRHQSCSKPSFDPSLRRDRPSRRELLWGFEPTHLSLRMPSSHGWMPWRRCCNSWVQSGHRDACQAS